MKTKKKLKRCEVCKKLAEKVEPNYYEKVMCPKCFKDTLELNPN